MLKKKTGQRSIDDFVMKICNKKKNIHDDKN